MRRFTLLTLALTATVAFLIGLIMAGSVTPGPTVWTAPPAPASTRPAAAPTAPAPSAGASLVNFADVAERINPAVVNIDAASTTPRERRFSQRRGAEPPFDGDAPFMGAGSGFIIDQQGHILTNYHVIEAAERISVTLSDGRVFRAEIVGTDPAIDVALIRIPGASGLPVAPLGNSDDLRVGEWVCAIGNPLGWDHSVTAGVVSFIGRKLYDRSLDDYIQTDAAINVGNSGGPLINARGEVVGINSAISARANNIGFAVPINQAALVLPQLKARGRVSRGFMGVMLTDVTPDLQRSLALGANRGALVQDLTANSPGERAGIRPYDLILEVDGRPIWTNDELIRLIAAREPGGVARIRLLRDGRELALNVKLAERPTDEAGALRRPEGDGRPAPLREPAAGPRLGLGVRDLDAAFVRRHALPASVRGVVVTMVDPAGPAYGAVRRNWVIMEVNRQRVGAAADFTRLADRAGPGDVLAFYCFDPAIGQRVLVTVTIDDPS